MPCSTSQALRVTATTADASSLAFTAVIVEISSWPLSLRTRASEVSKPGVTPVVAADKRRRGSQILEGKLRPIS